MKKIAAIILLILISAVVMAADQRILYNEKMVGAGHPTLTDTLNRFSQVEHNTDGSHKYVGSSNIIILKSGDGLNAAITSAGTNTVTLLIIGTVTLSGGAVVSPANISYEFESPGKISKSSGTLTINGPFSAGLYQVFSGFSAGEVTFRAGSVREVYPEWWGIVGTNDEDAVNKAITSIDSGNVIITKTLYIDSSAIAMKSGIALIGAGRGDSYNGTRGPILYNRRASGGAVSVGGSVSNISIEGILFTAASTATGQYGVELLGDAPNSSFNISIIRNTFFKLDKGIYAHEITPVSAWQCDHVLVEQNTMNEVNVGIHLISQNADGWALSNNTINYLNTGIYLEKSGYVTIDTSHGGGVGGVANNTFIKLYIIGPVVIMNSQAEQTDWFLHSTLATGNIYGITLIRNTANAPCKVDGPISLISEGNYYSYDFTFTAGDSVISSTLDIFDAGKRFVLVSNTRIAQMVVGDKVKYRITIDDNQLLSSITNTLLSTTNDTKVASLVPPDLGGTDTLMYQVYASVLSIATPTVRVHVKWKDGTGTINDQNILPATVLAVGTKAIPVYGLLAIGTTATAIEVWAESSVANQAYISAQIVPLTY